MSSVDSGIGTDPEPGRIFLLLRRDGFDKADADRVSQVFGLFCRVPSTYERLSVRLPGMMLACASPPGSAFELSFDEGTLAFLDGPKESGIDHLSGAAQANGFALRRLRAALQGKALHSVSQMPGGWSFISYDPDSGDLLACRDLFGSCPLYFRSAGSALWLSNAPQMLLFEKPIPNLPVLRSYASLGPPQLFGSPFSQVSRVPPGFLMSVARTGQIRWKNWWQPAKAVLHRSDEQSDASRFRRSILSAVGELIGSAGVASTLSGGLDSSVVTAAAAIHSREIRVRPTLAIAMRFPGDSQADEGPFVSAVQAHLGIDCSTISIRDAISIGDLEKFYKHQWVPQFINAGWFLQIAAEARARGYNVVLTGVGGDHISNGHLVAISDLLLQQRPGPAARLLLDNWIDGSLSALEILRWSKPLGWRACLARPWSTSLRRQSERHVLLRLLYGLRWRPVLEGVGRLGAAYGVTFLHPLLDPRLIQFVLSLSAGRLFLHGDERGLYRSAISGLLPGLVSQRHGKADFSGLARNTYEEWLSSAFPQEMLNFGLLSQSELQRLRNAGRSEKLDGLLVHLVPVSVFVSTRF